MSEAALESEGDDTSGCQTGGFETEAEVHKWYLFLETPEEAIAKNTLSDLKGHLKVEINNHQTTEKYTISQHLLKNPRLPFINDGGRSF